jgi:FdhD protein
MTIGRARRPGPTVRARVTEVRGGSVVEREDRLATEEPLELRLQAPGLPGTRLGITMRTPGTDFELAAGWVAHEGVVRPADITTVRYCTDVDLAPEQEFNVVTVESAAPPRRLPHAHVASSACGVCGADTVADVLALRPPVPEVALAAEVVQSLPARLLESQQAFSRTGGLHAAGLFEADGTGGLIREDVGRHNAVDKVVGACLLGGTRVPPVLVLSGRIGFELVQKAVMSGVGAVVAIGAPSSLAVDLARQAGLLLVGFTREDRFVAYAGADRLGV